MAPRPTPAPLTGTLIAQRPPPACLGAGIPILLGVQHRSEVEQVVTVSGGDESFTFDLGVVVVHGERDFRGPYVHGPKGQRFLYLVWGHHDESGEFVRFARSKLMLADLPGELLDEALGDVNAPLTCRVRATNDKGQCASGTIRPPGVEWTVR